MHCNMTNGLPSHDSNVGIAAPVDTTKLNITELAKTHTIEGSVAFCNGLRNKGLPDFVSLGLAQEFS
jgi:hypothetical protein